MQLILLPHHRYVVFGRQWKTRTDRVSSATTSEQRRPYSDCRQLCHSLRQKWSTDRGVTEAARCNSVSEASVCVTGEHILYMSACGVQQQQFKKKKKTNSPRSSSVSIPRQDRSRQSDSAWLSLGAARVEDHL